MQVLPGHPLAEPRQHQNPGFQEDINASTGDLRIHTQVLPL